MSQLLIFRNKANLTQAELAKKANVSVRTIQRIESGAKPKGFTLEAIAKVLDVPKTALLDEEKVPAKSNQQLVKYINLSSLPFIVVPLANIAIPLLLMLVKKKFNPITKQIISIQILWTILTGVLVVLSAFIIKGFSLSNNIILVTLFLLLLLNLIVILINTMALDKNNDLKIKLNFSFI